MHLSPSIELLIRDHLALFPAYIAIEGTAEFEALRDQCLAMDREMVIKHFILTEVKMPDGAWVDAIYVAELPSAACAAL